MKQQDQDLSLVAGAKLNRILKERNMTQEQAALMLGYSDARQIRRLIKNGITKIDEIQRIAKVFDVPFDEMISALD